MSRSPTFVMTVLLACIPGLLSATECFRYEHTTDWLGELTLPAPVTRLAAGDGLVACTTADALILVAAADAQQPAVLGQADLPDPATALTIAGGFAVVGTAGGDLHCYDISDPTTPFLAGSLAPGDSRLRDLQAGPGWLASADASGVLRVLRQTEGELPVAGWTVSVGTQVWGVARWHDQLLALGAGGLHVITVPGAGEPGEPVIERAIPVVIGTTADATVIGDLALVAVEVWLPVKTGEDVRYLEPFDINAHLGIDLTAPDEDEAIISYRWTEGGMSTPPLAATGTIMGMLAAGRVELVTPAALAGGTWFEASMSFLGHFESQLAATGSVLVMSDQATLRCMETATLAVVEPLHVTAPDHSVAYAGVHGRWTRSAASRQPNDYEYQLHFWYHADPFAPTLVDTYTYRFGVDGESALIEAAEGSRAVITQFDSGSRSSWLYDVELAPGQKAYLSDESYHYAGLVGHRLVTVTGQTVQCWDITDPTDPQLRGSLPLGGNPWHFQLTADRLFALTSAELFAVDITDLEAPTIAGTLAVAGARLCGQVSGLVLVSLPDGTVRLVDGEAQVLGEIQGSGQSYTSVTDGTLVAISWSGEGVDLVDCSDPVHPVRLHRTVSLGTYVYSLQWGQGDGDQRIVYAATGNRGGLKVLDFRLATPLAYGNSHAVHAVTLLPEGLLTAYGLLPLQCLEPSSVDQAQPTAPAPLVRLDPVAPNPFNPATVIRFDLAQDGRATLTLHDLRGRRVRTAIDERRVSGAHTWTWNGSDDEGRPLPSGTYLVRLSAGGEIKVAKAVLAR